MPATTTTKHSTHVAHVNWPGSQYVEQPDWYERVNDIFIKYAMSNYRRAAVVRSVCWFEKYTGNNTTQLFQKTTSTFYLHFVTRHRPRQTIEFATVFWSSPILETKILSSSTSFNFHFYFISIFISTSTNLNQPKL